jgi:hypothetical protein
MAAGRQRRARGAPLPVFSLQQRILERLVSKCATICVIECGPPDGGQVGGTSSVKYALLFLHTPLRVGAFVMASRLEHVLGLEFDAIRVDRVMSRIR